MSGLMPGSPRPGAPAGEVDAGVYRSLFQQPMLDVPPAAPAYAWFEFLLHPEALQQHVRASLACFAHSPRTLTLMLMLTLMAPLMIMLTGRWRR